MKQIIWATATVLVIGCLSGCGGGDPGTEKAAPKSEDPAAAQPSADDAASAIKSEMPDQAVEQFLLALRTGDDRIAEALLTVKARTETKRADMVVQPPGTPSATYEVGRVEYPDGEEDAAFVHCIWSETFDDNNVESFEVVWVLRLEETNWRIAGMATQLNDAQPPVFLNFEDPAEMMETVRQAENTNGQDTVANAPNEQTPTVR